MSQQTYLYSKVRKASIPRLARNFIEDLQIPVPPLPVQAEIVRILDNFTERTTELAEQLTAELTARKKQYEYYRDKLLTFGVHGGGGQVTLYGGRSARLQQLCGVLRLAPSRITSQMTQMALIGLKLVMLSLVVSTLLIHQKELHLMGQKNLDL